MTRKEYIIAAVIGAIFCFVLYWIVALWALYGSVPLDCSDGLQAYSSNLHNQDAALGHFVVGLIGIAFTFLGGWGCAAITRWVMEDPNN